MCCLACACQVLGIIPATAQESRLLNHNLVCCLPCACQVLGITASICAATWLSCYGALEYVSAMLPKLGQLDVAHVAAVSSLGATLMMARSPASAVGVRLHSIVGTILDCVAAELISPRACEACT